MSGASAVASARRRRASGQPEPPPNKSSNKNVIIEQQNNAQNNEQNNDQKLTPLQILQMHSIKISDLENSIEEKINSGIEQFLNTHVKTLPENESFPDSEELDKIHAKLASLEKSYTENLIETKELYKTKLSEETIIANLNNKIEQTIAAKINGLNDTIKSILMNIEKLSGLTKINEMYTTRIDNLMEELNTLKLLVIKTQTISLESSSDIRKIKDEIKEVETAIAEHNNILTSLNEDDEHDENDNIFNDGDATHMILKSMFGERMTGERMAGERMAGERMTGERVAGERMTGERMTRERMTGQSILEQDFNKINIHDTLDDNSISDEFCEDTDMQDSIHDLTNEQNTCDEIKQEVCHEIDILYARSGVDSGVEESGAEEETKETKETEEAKETKETEETEETEEAK
jgi:hypothetical protein